MVRPGKGIVIVLALMMSTIALGANFKPGEVIVKYKDGVMRTRSSMDSLYDAVGVEKIRHYSHMMRGFEQLTLNQDTTVEKAIAALEQDPAVEYAQPNYILHTMPVQTATVEENRAAAIPFVPCIIPGFPYPPGCEDKPSDPSKRPELKDAPADVIPAVKDTDLDQAYGLEKVGAISAWPQHRGSKAFVVADIDTGIDYNHEDLAFNVWRNPNPGDKKDVVGFDFVHNDGLPYDDQSHGTHTAGTIGAVGGNGIGISGVAPRVSVMAVKFLSATGSGSTSDAVRAIDYSINNGARVINASWGGKGQSDNKILQEAIDRAKAKDVLFIAAAGNDGEDNDGSQASYPAALAADNLIAVAATDQDDRLAYFSNYGKKTTHVAAPGVKIYSTTPDNKYASLSGTSMACPHVAGAVALIWSEHPEWNYKKVKEVLVSTVDPLENLKEKTITGGRINVLKALSVTN